MESIFILHFLHGHNHLENVASETTTLVGCGQLNILPNQILEFYYQFFLKGSIWYLSFFLYGCSHQRNLVLGTTSFGWVWQVVSLIQSDCRILWSEISLERTNPYFWKLPLLIVCGQLCFWSNRIPGFLDNQYLWIESIDTFVWPFSFYIYFLFISLNLLSNLVQVHLVRTFWWSFWIKKLNWFMCCFWCWFQGL